MHMAWLRSSNRMACSNVMPAEVTGLVHAALDGCWERAREQHRKLYPLFRDLFVETNPIPVKAALAMLGRIDEEYRLPLCPLSASSREQLLVAMRAVGLAV